MADANGNLTVSGLPAGTYTLTLQTGSYLMAVETVTVTGSNDTADFGELLAGDANGDNAVNILDLSILAGAYNASDGDGSFNPATDFNGDGVVNILDLSLLAGNYNMTGERP